MAAYFWIAAYFPVNTVLQIWPVHLSTEYSLLTELLVDFYSVLVEMQLRPPRGVCGAHL